MRRQALWRVIAIAVGVALLSTGCHRGSPSLSVSSTPPASSSTATASSTQALFSALESPTATASASSTRPITPSPTSSHTPTASPYPSSTATASATWSPTCTATPTPTPLPAIVASYPIDGDRSVPSGARLTIVLANDVDPASVEAGFAFSPTLEGNTAWLSPSQVTFIPSALLTETTYAMSFTLRPATGRLRASVGVTLTFATGTGETPIPILMYHRLRDLNAEATPSQRDWTVSPTNFAAQLDYLAARGYHTIGFDQLVAYFEDQQPLPPRPIVISMDDGYREVYEIAWPLLAEHGFFANLFVLPGYVGYPAYLDWDQMKALREAGFYFGSHTFAHADLRKLSPDQARREICDSKAVIEEKLGQPVLAFCYPMGAYNAETIALLKECGYKAACTLASGYRQRAANDGLFRLRRIRVDYRMSLEEFAAKLPW